MKSYIAGLVGILALALLVAAAALGLDWTVGAAIVLAVAFGLGWPHALAIPARKTLGAVIALTGAASALSAGLSGGTEHLAWTPIYIAVGFAAVMMIQVIRGTGQLRRLESTLGAGAGVAVAGFAGGWVASWRLLEEPGLTLSVAIAAVLALLLGMLAWPDRVLAPLTIALAALASTLSAYLFLDGQVLPAFVMGLIAGAVMAAARRLRVMAGAPANVLGEVAVVLAPLLALGSLVYFVEKLFVS
ncbi:permease [Specibacter sp. NPDC057265]|uniref:permease n=1 Tax=Specibacter sp. NPDC057265 TaxID=3346075 RepID=UPI00362F4EEA